RFADSTRVYQGVTRGDLRDKVDALHRLMIGREPDLTLIIDMDPETGLARAKGRGGDEERFEDFGLDMQRRMRAAFLDLAHEFPRRCRVIDGNRAPEEVAADVNTHAEAALL
ncbi:thymidylate kinase, partial [Escherichia coli]|nr:thymidylate kinase [Escherichia coli]